jgi:TPR repeat protein
MMSSPPRTLLAALAVASLLTPGPASAQSGASQPRIALLCLPEAIAKYREVWLHTYPGGREDQFTRLIIPFIVGRDDPGEQYRVKDGAFEAFDPARTQAADVLEIVPAQASCPPGMVQFLMNLDAAPARPAAPAQEPAPRKRAPTPAASDKLSDNDRQCEALVSDAVTRGLNTIDVARARPVCEAAAKSIPTRAQFQFLYGLTLIAAKEYVDAGIQLAGAYVQNHAMATYYLGLMEEAGLGAVHDRARAADHYRIAGDAGVGDAYARLGALMIDDAKASTGQTQSEQFRRAAEVLQVSADLRATSGLANLGWLYERGLGVPQDPVRAARLYDQAARSGDTMGAYRMGIQYLNGTGGVTRYAGEACQLFERAALAGFSYAQAELGNCLFRGDGKPQDHAAAFQWFLKAAEAGLARAQEIVGELYVTGNGVATSDARGTEWFRKAAEQGDPYGMFEFGASLRMGRGIATDEVAATGWFQKAAALGDTGSMFSLGLGYLQGVGGLPQDYGQARHWFAEAAKYKPATNDQEVTLAFARMNLAALYEKGQGVAQDLDQARALYTLAAKCPNPEVARMARVYLNIMPQSSSSDSSASDFWSNLIPAVVIGGAAALAVNWAWYGSTSSESSPDYTFDWGNSYYTKSYTEQQLDRMAVGCLWDEYSYLAYGHC